MFLYLVTRGSGYPTLSDDENEDPMTKGIRTGCERDEDWTTHPSKLHWCTEMARKKTQQTWKHSNTQGESRI